MKEEKQLVLFYRENTTIDSSLVATKLSEKFPCLEDPVVLPFDKNNLNQPLIIYERGKIKLLVGTTDLTIVYDREYHKELYDTIMDIIEYFEELDIFFERMGYISTFLHTKKEKENLKNVMFSEKSPIGEEFQLSWYKKELIDSVLVNVWIKEMTDIINNVELITVYDINTPMDEVYNISSDFLRDFIKECDKYIEIKEKIVK